MPNINFIVIDKNSFFSTLLALFYIYKNYRFDLLLHMQVSLRSNLVSMFIKAKRKIGFDKCNSKDMHSMFINERIDAIIDPGAKNSNISEAIGFTNREAWKTAQESNQACSVAKQLLMSGNCLLYTSPSPRDP